MTLKATTATPDNHTFAALGQVLIDTQLDVVDDWRREIAAEHNLDFRLLEDGQWVVGAAALVAGTPGSLSALTTVCSSFDSGELETLLDAFSISGPTEWWVRGGSVQPAERLAAQRGLIKSRQIDKMVSNSSLETEADTIAFEPSDAAGLAAVNNAAFAEHKDRAHWTDQTVLEEIKTLDNDYNDIRLHKHDGEIAGFVWTRLAGPHTGEIYVLAVDPAAHSRGLGRSLLSAGVGHLRSKGAKRIFLYVDADNDRAKHLYETAGFVDVEEPLVSYLIEAK